MYINVVNKKVIKLSVETQNSKSVCTNVLNVLVTFFFCWRVFLGIKIKIRININNNANNDDNNNNNNNNEENYIIVL